MKFGVTKRLSLDFLGEKWKEADCYLEFTAFTIRDMKDDFSSITDVDAQNTKSVAKGIESTLKLLEGHFLSGKGIDTKGEVVDIKKDDLADLPAEIISRVFGFLSESIQPSTPKQ